MVSGISLGKSDVTAEEVCGWQQNFGWRDGLACSTSVYMQLFHWQIVDLDCIWREWYKTSIPARNCSERVAKHPVEGDGSDGEYLRLRTDIARGARSRINNVRHNPVPRQGRSGQEVAIGFSDLHRPGLSDLAAFLRQWHMLLRAMLSLGLGTVNSIQ